MKGSNSPNDHSVVAMRNDIIPALAKLKHSENRLFQYCLAHYDSRGDENPSFEVAVMDIREYFHIDSNTAYSVIRQAMMRLSTRPLEWRENNVRKFRHWFDGFNYYENEGRFEFKINKDAEPFFLMLKDFFTRYRLEATKNFKHAATFKLYINVKQWENTSRWEANLDELKYRLGVAGKYPRWSDFSRWFLQPSVDEINEHSDLSITWKPKKSGRRVVGVAFKIKAKCDVAAQNAREIHETNQLLKDTEEEEKRLGAALAFVSRRPHKTPDSF